MKLIITGATGSAGSEVLRQALLDSRITAVTTLTRSPLPPYILASCRDPTSSDSAESPAKLTQIVHSDFSSYPPDLVERLGDHDACVWALGRSSVGMNEADYTRLTHDYAVAAAKAFGQLRRHEDDPKERKFVFAFLSGSRATQTPSKASGFFSTPMWARVKGRTELALAQSPHVQAYSFRPAFIVPQTLPPPEHRSDYNTPFYQSLGKLIGSVSSAGAVGADVLAKAMIQACIDGATPGGLPGWEGKGKPGDDGAFENAEIRRLGGGLGAK